MTYSMQGKSASSGLPELSGRNQPSAGVWQLAWRRLLTDQVGVAALVVVLAYIVLLLCSVSGLVAADWDTEVADGFALPAFVAANASAASKLPASDATSAHAEQRALPDNPRDTLGPVLRDLRAERGDTQDIPLLTEDDYYGVEDPLANDLRAIRRELAGAATGVKAQHKSTLWLGTDKWGHDVLQKTIKGSETSIVVGLAAALLAVALGAVFGAMSGYFGGRVDDFFNWFYSIFTAIPYLLLVLAVAAVLQQRGVATIILILGVTGWTGTYRLIRAEYIKHKSREYVMAASAIGASHARRMFSHIFPNVSHVVLVQMSVLTVGFIKSEVILSFLGFGVPVGMVSWGSMLNEAQNELLIGKWWQMAAASIAMAILVTAFSLLTDALRDALDPKLK